MKNILILLFIISNCAISEVIDGPANVRDKINGEILFSLNDSVVVYPSYLDNKWYHIFVHALIKKDDLSKQDSALSVNTKIYNKYKKHIGTSINKIPVKVYNLKDGFYQITLQGVTFKNNIRKSFSITKEFEKLLNKGKSVPNKNDLINHIQNYDYNNWSNFSVFENYISYSSSMEDPSPGPELILFFKEKKLFAILHLFDLKSNKFVYKNNVAGYTISFFEKENSIYIKEFEDHYYNIIRYAD